LVVSEERGDIHLAEEGKLSGPFSSAELRSELEKRLVYISSRTQKRALGG